MAALEKIMVELRRQVQLDRVWAAIAALADELVAHEMLEEECVEDVLGFWFR